MCGRAPGRHTARGSGRLVTAVTVTGTVTVTVLPRPGAGTGRGPPARQWRAAAVTVTVTDRDSGPACDGTVTRTVTEGLEHPGPGAAARCPSQAVTVRVILLRPVQVSEAAGGPGLRVGASDRVRVRD